MSSQCDAIFGIDFTSAPSPRKSIVVAHAVLEHRGRSRLRASGQSPALDDSIVSPTLGAARPRGPVLKLLNFERLSNWSDYEAFLESPLTHSVCAQNARALLGAFDFPFGLPKGLLRAWQWDAFDYREIALRFSAQSRQYWLEQLKAFCDARPVGEKFARRACDGPAGSSPSMKWVNPPVVFMYREGFIRLIRAAWTLPGFSTGAPLPARPIALEAYPGHLARLAIGKLSYKSDRIIQDPKRSANRALILERLSAQLPIDLECSAMLQDSMIADGQGDLIDAWLCAIQAAWAAIKGPPDWGVGKEADPQEGAIASLDLAAFFPS